MRQSMLISQYVDLLLTLMTCMLEKSMLLPMNSLIGLYPGH